jgi:plasmid stabilization system protein ParE
MSLPMEFRDEVPAEINEAMAWYEGQEAGMGREFFEALREHLKELAERPEIFAVEYRRIRRAPMRRFPYVVYYRLELDRVIVVAIQHAHRNPRDWRRRA